MIIPPKAKALLSPVYWIMTALGNLIFMGVEQIQEMVPSGRSNEHRPYG